MPTFTSVALDRLLEPRPSKSMSTAKNDLDSKLESRGYPPKPKTERTMNASSSKLQRRHSLSVTTAIDKKQHWLPITPALYTTPEPTPVPDSPSSHHHSPYVVNHKRRGPRLVKSFSEDDFAAARKQSLEGFVVDEQAKAANEVTNLAVSTSSSELAKNGSCIETDSSLSKDDKVGTCKDAVGAGDLADILTTQNGSDMPVSSVKHRATASEEDILEPRVFLSARSNTEGDSASASEQSSSLNAPAAEFFDAWEELSSESGPPAPLRDLEAELREIRLTLLMEIEKRKQAEEALDSMRTQWLKLRHQLSLVGLTLPADPVVSGADEQLGTDPVEDLCCQVSVARCVSNYIGRGIAKAEVEVEMEAQVESKNFELARLWDKLHYYEAVNREMSQRNQEGMEVARRLRQKRKRRQRWIWGLIAASITLGTGALSWSYLSSGKGPSTSGGKSIASDHDLATN